MPDSLPISGWVVLILQLLCAITLPVLGWGATVGNLQEEMNAALAVADSSDADFVQLILQQGFFEAFGGIALPAAWDQKWSAVNESTAIDFSIFEGDAPESPSRILLGTNSKLHIDGISLLGLSPSTQSQAASEQGQGDISEDLLHLLSAAFYLGNSNSALWLSNVDVEVAEGSGCELLRSIQTTACDALAMGQFQSGPGFVYLENYTVTATKSQLQAVQLTGVNISCPSDPLLLFQLDNPMSAFNTSYIWDYPQQVTDALPTTPLLQCAVAMVIDYAQLKEKAENLQRFSMRVFITIRSDIHFPSSESHSGLPPIYVHRNVKIMGVPRDDSWRLNSTFLSDASSPWAAAEAIELDLGNNLNVWNVDMNTGILELHNMTVVGLALGSDELYPMSMLVGAMWAANFDRPKATRNMLLFVNCILIVPPDLYSYLAYWSAAQDSRVPQVKLTAEWFRLYIFFYIDINRADSHNIYMNERRGSGTQWINTTLSNKIRRTSPFLTSTGIQAISSVDPYLPLDQLRTVGNASELVQVLEAELAGISHIIIMNNMSLRDALKNGTVAAHGVLASLQTRPVTIAGRPMLHTTLDLGGMSNAISIQQPSQLTLQRLTLTGLGPASDSNTYAVSTELQNVTSALWSFEFLRSQSLLTLRNITLLLPTREVQAIQAVTEGQIYPQISEGLRLSLKSELILQSKENRSLCLAVNASTKCINYYVLGLAGIKGGGIFMVDSLSAGAYIATPPQENLQLGLTAPAGPTDTAPEPEGGSSNLSLAAIALIAVACVVGGSLVVIGTFFYMRTSKHRAAMREAAMNSKAGSEDQPFSRGLTPGASALAHAHLFTGSSIQSDPSACPSALQHEAQTCSAISITIEKQYNSSGLNAAPGPGSIHKQYTSSDTTAAPGSGSIQKQYNSSDTTAAPGPGSIHKQYTSCGTTAAPGSGSIHKQYTSSDTTAAPGPGSIQKQYTSSGVTAISGPGSIQSTKYSDHLVSGQVTSVASARGSVEHGLPVTAMLFKGSSSGILPQFQRTLPSSVLALSSSSDGLFPLFGSEPLNSEHARQALAASVRDRPREGGEASGTPPSGHSTVEMSALHHRASMVSEASSSSERDSSPNVVLLPLSVTQISSQQTSGGSTLASFAESSGSNALASYVESQDEGSVWEAPSGDRLMGPMGAFAQARTSNSGGLPVLDRVSPPFQGLVSHDSLQCPMESLNQAVASQHQRMGLDLCQVEVEEILGQGAFGVVYKGKWRSMVVAIKVLIFHDASEARRVKQRALTEAAINQMLSHDNIVNTYAHDLRPVKDLELAIASQSHWKLYIIQEYCDGGTLAEVVDKGIFVEPLTGRIKLEFILQLGIDIAQGLAYIHERNIIHGDVSPGNVMLRIDPNRRSSFQAKIGDFGLSRFLDENHSHISNARQGTPFYIAPEVYSAGCITKLADVYSFGVMLWEMYTGRPPWRTNSGASRINPQTFKHTFPPGTPKSFEALVMSCCFPYARARPRAAALVTALHGLQSELLGKDVEGRPSPLAPIPACRGGKIAKGAM